MDGEVLLAAGRQHGGERRHAERVVGERRGRRDAEPEAEPAAKPVSKPAVDEDDTIDVDALKAENEALKAKLAEAESKAAAAIDA